MIKFKMIPCLYSLGNATRSKSVMMGISIRCPRNFHTLVFAAGFLCIFVMFPSVFRCNAIAVMNRIWLSWQDSLAKNEISFSPFNSNRLMHDLNGILSQFHIMSFFINVSPDFL